MPNLIQDLHLCLSLWRYRQERGAGGLFTLPRQLDVHCLIGSALNKILMQSTFVWCATVICVNSLLKGGRSCIHQAGSTTQCAHAATTSSCLPTRTPKLLGSMPTCPRSWPWAWLPQAASCWHCPLVRMQMTARPPTRRQPRSLTHRRTCCMACCTPTASVTCCASTAWRAAHLHSQAYSSFLHIEIMQYCESAALSLVLVGCA